MKYLIIIVALSLACSSPSDTTAPEPEHYTITYSGSMESPLSMIYATCYNPETEIECEYHLLSGSWNLGPFDAYSGQTLWVSAYSDHQFKMWIEINGEIVAESITADSIYVEYRLP